MKEAGEADQGTRVIQAAAGRRRSREERAAVSGRRQTGTMEEAAEEGSEHEGASLGNVSTIGEGARARSAEGGASASTLGEGAGARRAKQTRTSRCRRASRSSEGDPVTDPHTLTHTGFSQRHIGSANVLDNAGLGHIQR